MKIIYRALYEIGGFIKIRILRPLFNHKINLYWLDNRVTAFNRAMMYKLDPEYKKEVEEAEALWK